MDLFKRKVILDTNFLLIPGQFKVNVFAEIERVMDVPYHLCIIDKTVDELKKVIVFGNTKDRQAAKLGLALVNDLLKQKSLKRITSSSSESVDDAIVYNSSKKVYVATVDKELKRRVKEKGGSIITLKQKKYLVRE
ncbi:MAG: hypothetical protein KJ583_00885 [Nanoarchaeota archaeon]|nr:hypothetical protein [Nanoarchaeota archaeon]MBU1269342.1 hypothetical protein [Nanoarchaeota archaeon]MBU1603845.1 hypothetical protein [Nanoarchaeota archaeon]MBU2442673.1 hypothetical protein [Nanoarchaeota archaeon]